MSKSCANCGAPFASPQPGAIYCSRKCKTDAANLAATRGKQLYELAYGWATGSGAKFADLSWLVRSFVKEDREAGREPPQRSPFSPPIASRYMTAKDVRETKKARQRREANG